MGIVFGLLFAVVVLLLVWRVFGGKGWRDVTSFLIALKKIGRAEVTTQTGRLSVFLIVFFVYALVDLASFELLVWGQSGNTLLTVIFGFIVALVGNFILMDILFSQNK